MKEEQKRQDSLEYLKAYIARHCGRMTPEQISEELQVPLFAVKMHWPNPEDQHRYCIFHPNGDVAISTNG